MVAKQAVIERDYVAVHGRVGIDHGAHRGCNGGGRGWVSRRVGGGVGGGVGGRGQRVRISGSTKRGVSGAVNQDGHRLKVNRGRNGLCNSHGDVVAIQERDDRDNGTPSGAASDVINRAPSAAVGC